MQHNLKSVVNKAAASLLNPPKRINRLFELAGTSRGTGRSTGLALGYLSSAILKPNEWIVVIDHHGTPESNKALMFMCKALVEDMGLKFFAFEFKQNTGTARIRCDIFGV